MFLKINHLLLNMNTVRSISVDDMSEDPNDGNIYFRIEYIGECVKDFAPVCKDKESAKMLFDRVVEAINKNEPIVDVNLYGAI